MSIQQGVSSSKESLTESYSARTNKIPELSHAGSILAKEILFACSNCDGPLVPASTCIVCKKITQRKCVHCNFCRGMYDHSVCKQAVLVGFSLKQKMEVN